MNVGHGFAVNLRWVDMSALPNEPPITAFCKTGRIKIQTVYQNLSVSCD